MAHSSQHDAEQFDQEHARRAGMIAIGWFLLVATAIIILLLFGDAFGALVA